MPDTVLGTGAIAVSEVDTLRKLPSSGKTDRPQIYHILTAICAV